MKEDLYTKAMNAKLMYAYGKIEHTEAVNIIKSYVDFVNETAERLAKEFNMKPKKISVTGFMR